MSADPVLKRLLLDAENDVECRGPLARELIRRGHVQTVEHPESGKLLVTSIRSPQDVLFFRVGERWGQLADEDVERLIGAISDRVGCRVMLVTEDFMPIAVLRHEEEAKG